MDLSNIAPYLIIRDLLDDGGDFRVRFWGTEMTRWFDFDGSQKNMKDYYSPEKWEYVFSELLSVIQTGFPKRVTSSFPVKYEGDALFEGLYLPLLGREDRIEHVLSVEQYVLTSDRGANLT